MTLGKTHHASLSICLCTRTFSGVTFELLAEAGLTVCGASGCWFLSLAACSCSLAKRCFSSRVRDIWGDAEDEKRDRKQTGPHANWTKVKICVNCKWGMTLFPYSIRLRGGCCRSVFFPINPAAAKDIINLRARGQKSNWNHCSTDTFIRQVHRH